MDEQADSGAAENALMVFDSVLDASLKIRQSQLNAAFLALATDLFNDVREHNGPVLGLSGGLMERLCGLSRDGVKQIGSCPFAIYGLRLQDSHYWRAVAADNRTSRYTRLPFHLSPARREQLVGFATMALHHAAGLAASNEYGAGLIFGVPLRDLRLLASTPLPALTEAAAHAPGLLCARLHDHPRIWRNLLEAAESGQKDRCFAAKSMAFQALAAASAAGAQKLP